MGLNAIQYEVYQQAPTFDFLRTTTPKTEPEVLRSITELISMELVTQNMISQLAAAQSAKLQTGQAFIRQGQRADEGAAFDNAVDQVRLLSQRVDELEKRLEQTVAAKGATAK